MALFFALLFLATTVVVYRRGREREAELQRQLARTAREAAEQRDQHLQDLTQEKAQQEALFNSMVEGVLLLDSNGRVRLVNQALEQLFGVPGEIRGQTIMEAFRSHDLQELVNKASVEGHVLDGELELPGMDQRCLQVNATAFLNRDGKTHGMILVFHDLTRIKQLENTRQEFVANVSHELRTPLSLIKGYVETLIDGAKDDPAVATRFLQTIQKHSDRLTYLIEDLLTISRLESGQVVLNLQPLELQPWADRIIEDLRGRAADRQVTIVNETPQDVEVRADADRLQQVLFNLVDNAIKYGKAGGRVIVGARAVEGNMIEISVQDNGPGIPPDATERVFERFYRVDRARSRDQGGTGLGLAIVKHIVQSHGGEVWVKSELGQGTTFYFTVPRT